MPASAIRVANEFLTLARRDGRSLTPLQVMKLVYVAHGWSLALAGRPLINETVEAWRYGPVIPDLYSAMKSYGARPIDAPLPRPLFRRVGPDDLDDTDRNVIRQTYNQYGALSGIQLSELTHRSGTPWSVTWEQDGQNGDIATDLITEHYRRLSNERRSRTS